MTPDPVGGSAARRAAQHELEHGEYHRDGQNVLERVLRWIGDKLSVPLHGGAGGHAILVLLVLLLAAVVFVLVKVGLPSPRARRAEDVEDDPLRPVRARDHRRQAVALAAQGRHAESVREWLRAAVQTIEDRGVLPPRPGRTGAASAREAGPLLPAAAEALRTAMSAFDEIWFGGRTAQPADVALAQDAADRVATARIEHDRASTLRYAAP